MAVTTENITDTLKSVIELLDVDDDSKIELAIDILTLVVNYIGAENIMGAMEDALENTLSGITDYISALGSDLSVEEMTEKLVSTRSELDALFEKMAVIES